MSKAFTRESDDAPDLSLIARPASSLPAGTKNYLTRQGARTIREELARLIEVERPTIANSNDETRRNRQLRMIDARIAQLQHTLETAEIVSPPGGRGVDVRFGATVIVRENGAAEARYRIVGVDETEFDEDAVSWISPVGRALLNARVGERVSVQLPAGEHELEILAVTYE